MLGGPGQLVACIAGRKKKARRLEHLCVWREGTATRAGGVVVHRWSCFWAVGPFEKRKETLAPSQQKLQMQKHSAFASVWGCLLSPGTRPGPQVESPD